MPKKFMQQDTENEPDYFKEPAQELDVKLPTIDVLNPDLSSIGWSGYVAKPKKYYEPAMWKGVKKVFKCLECGGNRDTEDEMVEHVILHVPEAERADLFDKLIMEMYNG